MRSKMEWKKCPFVRVVNFSTLFLGASKLTKILPKKMHQSIFSGVEKYLPTRRKSQPLTLWVEFWNLIKIFSYSCKKIKFFSALKNGVEKVPIRTRGEFFHSIFGRIEKNKFLSQKNAPKNIFSSQIFFADPAGNPGLRPGFSRSIKIQG